MNLFYVRPDQVSEHRFQLGPEEARHAGKVMRFSVGDTIFATDGTGQLLTGKVLSISKKALQAELVSVEQKPAPSPRITLALGMIKTRQRLEFAVEKSVELGAARIILFESAHTERTRVRVDRLEGIAHSAMKQSLRCHLPRIEAEITLSRLLEREEDTPMLLAHEKAENAHQTLPKTLTAAQEVLLLVGPEGGFHEDEVAMAQSHGAELFSLGSYRLRAETAAMAMLSSFLTS